MTTLWRCLVLVMLASCFVAPNEVELGLQSGTGSCPGVTLTGQVLDPPPAAIPNLAVTTGGTGLTADFPIFDWATVSLMGTATSSGDVTVSFDGVTIDVATAAGDTAWDVLDRISRCGPQAGYRYELLPEDASDGVLSVRRANSSVFARFTITNMSPDTLYVYADAELAYWLSISLTPGGDPLQLMPYHKPQCPDGAAVAEPKHKTVKPNEAVDFDWDGTYFTDQGQCWERQVLDGGVLYLDACAFKDAAATGPYSRLDGGADVNCMHTESVLAPHGDLAVDKSW